MNIQRPNAEVVSFEEYLNSNGVLVYTNVGKSMLPLIRQKRDIIEITRKGSERCKKYDAVLYKQGGRYVLHRIIKVRPSDYVIVGDNCIYREYGITDDMILGVLTRVIRDGKSIYSTDWKYRVYVHLWCDFYHIRAGILFCKMYIFRFGHYIKKQIKAWK